jgi:hypothetical protein
MGVTIEEHSWQSQRRWWKRWISESITSVGSYDQASLMEALAFANPGPS